MKTWHAFCCGLFCASSALAAVHGEEIKLWPNGAPGSQGVAAAEVSKPSSNPKFASLAANFTVTQASRELGI